MATRILSVLFCLCGSLLAAKPECSITAPDGTHYDLRGLSGLGIECTDAKKEYKYIIDPCGPTVTCAKTDCLYCQEGITWNNYFCVGIVPVFTGLNAGAGVSIDVKEGEGGREGKIDITCNPTAGDHSNVQCISPATNVKGYKFTFDSDRACPGQGGGLSGGSVLLIIIFSVSAFYLLAGVAYNKFVKHENGIDLIPNLEFWKDFPGLVQDGVQFTVVKVKGLL